MRRDGEGLRTIYPGLRPGLRYYATLWLQKALKGRNILARGTAPGIELPLRYYATLWLQKALKGRNILARDTAPGIESPLHFHPEC